MGEVGRSQRLVRFEGFELDVRTCELRCAGDKPVRLPDQPFQILAMLLDRPGDLVTREEIRNKLWPNGTIVEFEHSISAAMNRLRQVLGDSAENPQFIETLSRLGYRWMIPVKWVEAPGEAAARAEMAGGNQVQTASAGNLIGKKVSHYRVLEVLGGGGMGVVYKAEDIKLGRRVALKFLPEEVASEPSALERFEREARAASALDHPNICVIHEFGEHEGQHFIVMPLLEGQTLRERIGAHPPQPGKPLPTKELLEYAIQIAGGLEAAHQKSIIHRDIKPANIFITNRGEAKILDFGVAKLIHGDGELDPAANAELDHSPLPADPLSFSLNLTRTGTTVGTASYMSPEQIRSEKLDARTDLFSFGLVLHEMATGHQAFAGDTAENIREAILHRPVLPAQQLNPDIPSKVEGIIAKALEKDRNDRYQQASEMRADLEALQRDFAPRARARWRALAMGAVALLLIASTIFWFTRHKPASPAAQLDQEFRQLTFNAGENRVISGAISPDGKYLAYADLKGMHVKLIESGATNNIPEPEAFKNENVGWEVIPTWFPDSIRFLANAHPPGDSSNDLSLSGTSVWVFSVQGGAPKKLRDNASAYSISPDGSLISFGTKKGPLGDREIWLMGPAGEQARKLFGAGEDSSIGGFYWSLDGQRAIYVITEEVNGRPSDTLVSVDFKGGSPITLLSPSEAKNVNDCCSWLPDGRLIYLVEERQPVGRTCNFWAMRIDTRTGRPLEKAKRLTNSAGFCMGTASVTADGKRLAFLEWSGHGTAYMADLEAGGTRIFNLRHFTLDEGDDAITAWTADSKTAIVLHYRGADHYEIYRQLLNSDTPEPITSTIAGGLPNNALVSPDGKWVIALVYPFPGRQYLAESNPSTTQPVVRIPITGGSPELIFPVRLESPISCARAPSNLCVVAERSEDRKQMIVTSFDPVKGRGSELARFDVHPNLDQSVNNLLCYISPDGTRLATARWPAGAIEIRSLRGQPTRFIHAKGLDNLWNIRWEADGKGLIVEIPVKDGTELLHVDLQGNTKVLYKSNEKSSGVPSPDGRHLAINEQKSTANMWMMENF